MHLNWATFTVNKRFPLTISRGTTAQTTNVWVSVAYEGIEGWGEASPFGIGDKRQTTETILEGLQEARELVREFHPLQREAIERTLRAHEVPSAVRAAIETALWDWLGKRAGLPVWQILGLDTDAIVPTSVTIGINPPEIAQGRTLDWLELTGARSLKIKLGNPEGIEADKAMFSAIREVAPKEVALRVDANGGWSLKDALVMCQWLADRGVEYVEQPLARGQEEALSELYRQSPLPIFIDESCWDTRDVVRWSDRIHGINIKLMKCGGLGEALRMIHTARALGIQVMFGCYSDSSLAITAMAHLAPLADHLDLDSHLNLLDDPFVGASLHEGRIVPSSEPGLGVSRRELLG